MLDLDPMVVLVNDDDPVLGVAADARGSVELTRKTSADAEVEQEDAARREHLDAVVRSVRDLPQSASIKTGVTE